MSAWLAPLMFLGAALTSRTMLVTAEPIWWALLVGFAGALFCWSASRAGQSSNSFVLCVMAAMAAISSAIVTTMIGGHLRSETWMAAFVMASVTWLLCRSVAVGMSGVGAFTKLLTLVAAVVLVREVGSEELYEYPTLLMRGTAFGVLLLALVLWVIGGRVATIAGSENEVVRGSEGSLLAPSLAVVGFVLTILWALSLGPVRSVESRLRIYFLEDTEVTDLADFGDEDSSYFPGAGNGSGEGRSLPKRADIQLGDALRTVVQIDDRQMFEDLVAEPLYVRTLTLSVLEGLEGLTPLRRGEWRFDSDDGDNDGRVLFDESGDGEGRSVRHTVYLEATESNALPILSGMKSIQLDEVYEYADDWFQLALPEGQDLVAFRAVSDFERALASEELDSTWQADRTGSSTYRQIPATPLTEKLRSTARSVVPDQASLAQAMTAIRELLEGRCRYSLSYDNPDNLAAVENFLYAEQKGHCELFAATTVMLLRTLDIPARVAYGYSGGVARAEDRVVAFRDRDFHAWAEVRVEGRGWVVFDTTPAGEGARVVAENSPGADSSPSSGGSRNDNLIPDLGSYQMLAGTADAEVVTRTWIPAWLQASIDFAALYLTEICLSLLALFMVVWLGLIARARRRRKAGSGGGGSFARGGKPVALPGYLQEFFRLWSQRGETIRAGQTLREFVDALHLSGKCGDEFEGLVRYTYQMRYAGGMRDRDTERQLKELVLDFGGREEVA